MGAPYNPPTKSASFETYVSLRSFATPGSMQANPTLAAGDVKLYIDGVASTLGAGSSANLITLPTVVGTTVVVKVVLGSTEMAGDNLTVVFIDQTNPKEWEDLVINIVPGTGGGGATAAQVWDYLTSAISTSGSIGKLLKDDIDVVLSTGIQARLPAALVSGRIDASVGAMASGVVTATAVATDAIDADALATDAVTEIKNGVTAALLATVSSGTAQGPGLGSDTIQLASGGVTSDDQYNGYILALVSGKGAGQQRVVLDSINTGDYLQVVGGNWTTAPDSTTVYILFAN